MRKKGMGGWCGGLVNTPFIGIGNWHPNEGVDSRLTLASARHFVYVSLCLRQDWTIFVTCLTGVGQISYLQHNGTFTSYIIILYRILSLVCQFYITQIWMVNCHQAVGFLGYQNCLLPRDFITSTSSNGWQTGCRENQASTVQNKYFTCTAEVMPYDFRVYMLVYSNDLRV